MSKYGFLVDYEYCVGCRGCEISCRQEHQRNNDESGVVVQSIPSDIDKGKSYYYPFFTNHCNLCGKRIAKNIPPACAANCWAKVITFGTVQELAERMGEKRKSVLWAPH